MRRRERARRQQPRSVPWPLEGDTDVVAVDTTWGCRTVGSFGGRTIPGSVHIPHDEIVDRRDELDPGRVSILFCNGPQCPQSPHAIRSLIDAGFPAEALAYYRGGMHDWVTLSMPTEPRED